MGDRIELDVFVVDDRGRIVVDADDDDRERVGDQFRRRCHSVVEHARDLQATPGPRPGAVAATTSTRRGGDCDIVRSMRVDPWTASTIAGSQRFRLGRHRLLTFLDADPGDDRNLSWKVLVDTPRRRTVPATLHLRAAPSMVISVLELTPRRRLRWRRTAFIDAAVAAVDSLAREFEDQTAHCA